MDVRRRRDIAAGELLWRSVAGRADGDSLAVRDCHVALHYGGHAFGSVVGNVRDAEVGHDGMSAFVKKDV